MDIFFHFFKHETRKKNENYLFNLSLVLFFYTYKQKLYNKTKTYMKIFYVELYIFFYKRCFIPGT